MIAGMAYRANSLPMESVPNDTVLFCTVLATCYSPLIFNFVLSLAKIPL